MESAETIDGVAAAFFEVVDYDVDSGADFALADGVDDEFKRVGRPSTIDNEDNYDYAIELKPNDEYKLAAAALHEIIDFDTLDSTPTGTDSIKSNQFPNASALEKPTLWMGLMSAMTSVFAGRKGSNNGQTLTTTPVDDSNEIDIESPEVDKNFVDTFFLALTNGVYVRLHRSRCKSELILLHSTEKTVINWECSNCRAQATSRIQDQLSDRCSDSSDRNIDGVSSADNARSGVDYGGMNNESHKFNSGSFSSVEISDVRPASGKDPLDPQLRGTFELRSSEDVCNDDLTFSIVLTSAKSEQPATTTFDIECGSLEQYVQLFQGFVLLLQENEVRKQAVGDDLKSRRSRILQSFLNIFIRNAKNMDDIAKADFAKLKSVSSVPPAQFLGWTSPGTQIWARLKMAGLVVKCVYSCDLRRVILKVRCPQWKLEEIAERIHMKLRNRDGSLRRFKVSRRDTFVRNGVCNTIFSSSERQQIIDFIIRSKIRDGGAELDEGTELGKSISQKFPLHMHSRLVEIRHSWTTFWKKESADLFSLPWSVFNVPCWTTCARCYLSLQYVFKNLLEQPLDSIADYYGESIAFHFAYLEYYTYWLIFPSVLGLIVFCFQVGDKQLDHWLCIPYSISIMIWASFMLVFWRQRSSALAYQWGVLEYESEETERPQYHGTYSYDDTSGVVRKVYSPWKRYLKYLLSLPILSFLMFLMLVIMGTIFTTQDRLYDAYFKHKPLDYYPQLSLQISSAAAVNVTQSATWDGAVGSEDLESPDFWFVVFFYPCLYSIIIDLFCIFFDKIALALNNFENHRTQTSFMNRLILKVFSFRFVTVFTSLYYYAFVMENKEAAYVRIAVTIVSLMTVGQWWEVLLEISMPSLIHKTLLYYMKIQILKENKKIYRIKALYDSHCESADASDKSRAALHAVIEKRIKYLSQAKSKCWEEAICSSYDTFSDYTSMVIQLGFVLLFAAVFPLAPLIAFLNNIILIRLNAVKLCYIKQRPIAQKASGIGVWEDVLQIMSVVGILTNCGLIGLTSMQVHEHLQSLSDTGLAISLFALEHGILLFKYWLHVSIPRVPVSVTRAQARERKAALKLAITKAADHSRDYDNYMLYAGEESKVIVDCHRDSDSESSDDDYDMSDKKRRASFNYSEAIAVDEEDPWELSFGERILMIKQQQESMKGAVLPLSRQSLKQRDENVEKEEVESSQPDNMADIANFFSPVPEAQMNLEEKLRLILNDGDQNSVKGATIAAAGTRRGAASQSEKGASSSTPPRPTNRTTSSPNPRSKTVRLNVDRENVTPVKPNIPQEVPLKSALKRPVNSVYEKKPQSRPEQKSDLSNPFGFAL